MKIRIEKNRELPILVTRYHNIHEAIGRMNVGDSFKIPDGVDTRPVRQIAYQKSIDNAKFAVRKGRVWRVQ